MGRRDRGAAASAMMLAQGEGPTMCNAYWNLRVDVECPKGHRYSDELQTHFMGEPGSCLNYYALGEPVEELQGVTVVLDGRIDAFIGECKDCKAFYDCGAEIIEGRVTRVWALPPRHPAARGT